MRLSISLDYAAGAYATDADQIAQLERVGLDMVWVPEAYSFDAVSCMGYLAAKTSRVEIGSGILPIFTRTPTALAMAAAGIDALSNGRCVLGLGASGPQVIEGFHGVPYDRPLSRMRETIDICRKVWRRELLEHEGVDYTIPLTDARALKLVNRPVRSRIPIYLASLGPNNVQLTAEKADGWLPVLYIAEKAEAVWGADLAAGAAKRDADLAPLEVVAGGLLSIGDDAARARDYLRPTVALYVGGMGAKGRNFYNDLMCRYGFEAEAAEIQELFLAGKKEQAEAKVPDAFLAATTLCGSPGYVRERIAAYQDSGVTVLNVSPIGGDPVGMTEQVKGWIEDL